MGPTHAPAHDASLPLPESRVLIIGTGGTICMQNGPDGLQPTEGFMEMAMAPRPDFNDPSSPSGVPALHCAMPMAPQDNRWHAMAS